MKAKNRKSIKTIEKFKMPKWMECTWRRVPCGKNDCPICGRIKRDRQRHILKGEDPDDIKYILEDVRRNFKEVLEMIKKDCERKGIELTNVDKIKEPPAPEEFPLYKKVKSWRNSVFNILKNPRFEFWIYTEPVQDLFWYANILTAKVYRQLCNQWHIEHGDEYGEFDYQYTKYVLRECLRILKRALGELINGGIYQKEKFRLLLLELQKLENQIIKI